MIMLRGLMKLINKHFPKSNPLSKIINRNTVKISYRCSPNMGQIISSHNSKLLQGEKSSEERKCNCRKNAICPLGGKCLEKNVIYQATVTPKNNPTKAENYVGLCSTTFKERFHNHTASFKYKEKANSTKLSSHIWDLKNKKIDFHITWKILERAKHFSPVTGLCNLCTKEKYFIIFEPEKASLNKKEELNNNCLHKYPQLLVKPD